MPTKEPKGTWDDPSVAMRFRDMVERSVSLVIDRLRPTPQYGTVLDVYRDGASFRTGTIDDQTGPPPPGPGNPTQVYYASVRLDTGETVTARVHENIPVARRASMYSDTENMGSGNPYLIANDVYRRTAVVARTDANGNTYDSVEPEDLQLTFAPTVPPRVMIEGQAGKYVLTRIVRGMVRYEDAILERPQIVSPSKYYNHIVSAGNTELRPIFTEYVTQYQGFVGGCGWTGEGTFEVELAYGLRYQKYVISSQDIAITEWNTWRLVPPTMETSGLKDPGFSSSDTYNVLMAYYDSTGKIYFYVCNRSLVEYYTDTNQNLGGTVTLRSLNRALVPTDGEIMPDPPASINTTLVWGLSRAKPYISSVIDHAPVVSGQSPFWVAMYRAQTQLAGGGVYNLELSGDTTKIYFKWGIRFSVQMSKSAFVDDGFFVIEMPTIGVNIPVVGGNATDGGPLAPRPVTSQGIDLTGNCNLYYALPFGPNASVPGNFVIVQRGGWFDVPAHWILIARRNSDAGAPNLTLGNGQEVDRWRDWNMNIADTESNGTFPLRYKKENGRVYLAGAITALDAVSSGATSTSPAIPQFYRPYRRYVGQALYISAGDTAESMRFDISAGGIVQLGRALGDGGRVFVDQISYPVDS